MCTSRLTEAILLTEPTLQEETETTTEIEATLRPGIGVLPAGSDQERPRVHRETHPTLHVTTVAN